MGIFPTSFADQSIKYRIPYSMPGELIVDTGLTNVEFPAAAFLQNTELPFEIHAVKLVAAQDLNAAGQPFVPIADPAPSIDQFWRVRIRDTSKINAVITKNAQLVASLKSDLSGYWEWDYPYTIVNSEGFTISVDNLLTAPARLRAAITFIGYSLVIRPPSQTRG
ncbi:hypothetical protein LCGC14_0522970 [marine sediment metagenome]|uniref:Uncharacterized protein n=1 Tax=marine sediment metagenome TaxID=412755 RepID=A0A0F9RY39_9ZZZZ